MTYPSPSLFPSNTLFPSGSFTPSGGGDSSVLPDLPSAGAESPESPVLLHVGEVLSGRITATIPVTSASWSAVLNDSGAVSCTVAESVVREYDLRSMTDGSRCFLAFERDGRMKQAGPIRGRAWDWEKGALTLSAVGIWGWLDQRHIYPTPTTLPLQKDVVTFSGKSLGGIARALVELAISHQWADVPIVLPADELGAHTESFPLWSLLRYGDQIRQITQRASDAPDVAFVPRRTFDDPRFIEWAMRVGTELAPTLQQAGPDWVFDTTAPRSPVFGIATDEDASALASYAFVTGNGQETSILLSFQRDTTLLDGGWPLTEVDASYPTVELQATLDGYATSLVGRSGKPIESYKVTVAAEAVPDVQPGDFCQVITRGDAWLGDVDRQMRVKTISGDLGDKVSLEMFPMAAQ